MIFPSLIAIVVPVAVGLVFDVGGVLGLTDGWFSNGFRPRNHEWQTPVGHGTTAKKIH